MFKKKGDSIKVSKELKSVKRFKLGALPLTIVSAVALLGSLSLNSLYDTNITSKNNALLTLADLKDSVVKVEKNIVLTKVYNQNAFKELDSEIKNIDGKLKSINNENIKLEQSLSAWGKVQPSFKTILAEKTKGEEIKKDLADLNGKTKILVDSSKVLQAKSESLNAGGQLKDIASLTEKTIKNLEGILNNNSIAAEKSYLLNSDLTVLNSLLAGIKSSTILSSDVELMKILGDFQQILKPYSDFNQKINKQIASADVNLKPIHDNIDSNIATLKELSFDEYQYAANILGLIALIGIGLLFVSMKQKTGAEVELKNEINQLEEGKKHIQFLIDGLNEINKGNLDKKIELDSEDYAQVSDKLYELTSSFKSILSNIESISSKVELVSQSTEATSSKLLDVSGDQYSKLGKSMEKIGQITNDVDELAQITWIAKEDSTSAQKASMEGSSLVKQSIEKMDEIRNTIQESSKKIKKLGESAQAITEVTGLIQGITKQINVLALNAAIQAASSGESGREFTVVAQEVQRLAKDSEDATKKIEKLISDIQGDTASAIASMEKTTQEVVSGAKLTDNAGKASRQIDDLSKSVAERISDAANRLEDKSAEMVVVAKDIKNLQKISEEVTDIVKIASDQVSSLKDISKQLNSSVSVMNKK